MFNNINLELVLSIAGFFVAICALVTTIFYTRASFENVRYMKKSYIAEHKGYVGHYVEGTHIGGFSKTINIKNFEKTPCTIKRINYDCELPPYLEKYYDSLINKVFMPHQNSSCVILPDSYNIKFNVEYCFESLGQFDTIHHFIDLEQTSKELYSKVEKHDNFENDLLNVLLHIYRKM